MLLEDKPMHNVGKLSEAKEKEHLDLISLIMKDIDMIEKKI